MNTKATTIVASALILFASLTGCASGDAKAAQAVSQGKAEVHERIKAESDCIKLQEGFNLADANGKVARNNGNMELANANTAYMKTTLDRQNELKCFG